VGCEGIVNRVFKVGIIDKRVARNPVDGLETSAKTSYRAIKISCADALDPAFHDAKRFALHFGVSCGGNSPSKFRGPGSPLG
jgi:hypothetical protein